MLFLAVFLMTAAIGKSDVYALFAGSQSKAQTQQAEDTSADQQEYGRLVDEAGLLTEEEAAELSEKLDTISEKQECDVVVVTVDSLDGKPTQRTSLITMAMDRAQTEMEFCF